MDYLVFSLVCAGAWIAVHGWLKRQQLGSVPAPVFAVLGGVLVSGWFLVEKASERERANLRSTVSGLAPTYAAECEILGHEHIDENTPADHPLYLRLVEAQKRWLKLNPAIADIYTWGRKADGQLILLVDSETDYNRNGKIDEPREERTVIGEPYEETPSITRAFAGEAFVEESEVTDRWGTWVSAYAPVRNPRGDVVAVLGVDYEASAWRHAIRSTRLRWIMLLGLFIALGAGAWGAICSRNAGIRQAAIRASEQRLHRYFESLPHACWALDQESRFTLLNVSARQAWKTATLGEPLANAIMAQPPERQVLWREHHARAAAGETVTFVFSESLEADQTSHFEVTLAPLRQESRIVGVVGAALDITERTEAEVARHATERKLALHLRRTPLAIVEWDLTLTITAWNPAAETIFGIPRLDALGKSIRDLVFKPEDQLQATRELSSRPSPTGTRQLRFEHLTPHGQRKLCEWSISTLSDDAGRTVATAAFVQDITERDEMEGQLRHVQRLESVGRLAGGLAHEFNNLFTPMAMHLEMLEADQPANPATRARLAPIRTALNQAIELSHRMLALGRRNESEKPTWQLLNPAVQDTLELLRRGMDARLRLLVLLAPDLPKLPLLTSMVAQVVMNLLLNARDALMEKLAVGAPGWQPVIRVSTSAGHAARKQSVVSEDRRHEPIPIQCITITDTGMGMDQATRENLFEPFAKRRGARKGPGLGLAIAWQAVHSLGGWIEVDSVPGEGTTFRVYLPSPRPPDEPESEPALATKHAPTGRNIMVVDADELVGQAMADRLRYAGHLVTCYRDGSDALAMLRLESHAFDLVITDLNMPGVGGRDLLMALSREQHSPPVILMTGNLTTGLAQELEELGAAEVVSKPPNISDLLGQIEKHTHELAG